MRCEKVIIDTDLALGSVNADTDDALAVLTVLACPFFEVLAITASSGNVKADKASTNINALLKRIGRDDIKTCFSAGLPLDASFWVKQRWDLQRTQDLMLRENNLSSADLLRDTLRSATEPVTVISLGPLTNLAHALSEEPELETKIARIVMMGGSRIKPGVGGLPVEFNIKVDPEAAAFVFSKDVEIIVFPLDVTKKKEMHPEDIELWNDETRPFLKYLYDSAVAFMKFRSVRDNYPGCYAFMHDVMPVVYLLEPSFFTMERCNIAVDLEGQYSRGSTVIDTKLRGRSRFKHLIARDVDAEGLMPYVVSLIAEKWGGVK